MRSAEGLHNKLSKNDVLKALLLKIQAVQDVSLCRLVNNYRRFEGSHCPKLQRYIFQERFILLGFLELFFDCLALPVYL
jgi:hypothetical protein